MPGEYVNGCTQHAHLVDQLFAQMHAAGWLEEETTTTALVAEPASTPVAAEPTTASGPVGDGSAKRGPRPYDKADREKIVKRYLDVQHQVTQQDYAAQQGISERTLRRWIKNRS